MINSRVLLDKYSGVSNTDSQEYQSKLFLKELGKTFCDCML